MIGNNLPEAKSLVAGIRDVAAIASLDAAKQKEFDTLAESALLENFPGAVIAIPDITRVTLYYGICRDASDWRRLRPLLVAFAGPTVTRFTGWPEPMSKPTAVEVYLRQAFHVVARLVPGQTKDLQDWASRSLQRMVRLVSQAPVTTNAAPRSTSQLISLFVDALNCNDRVGAADIIELCRSELRLDALNLSFMKVQLLAHFEDWRSICDLPNFNSLCHTRKPPAVAAALLEAIYQTYLGTGNPANEEDVWSDTVRDKAWPLLRLPIPASIRSGGLRLYAMEALYAEPRRPELETAVLSRRGAIAALADKLEKKGRYGLPAEGTATDLSSGNAVTRVSRAVLNAETTENLSEMQEALQQFSELEEGVRTQLLRSESFKRALQYLQTELGTHSVPRNWVEWLCCLSDPAFTAAFAVLKRAVGEWSAGKLDTDEISQIASALNAVPEQPPALDRLADALPLLVSWAAEDQEFPRPSMTPLYEALLYHLLLCERRARSTYESSALLIRALLAVGISTSQYKSLLDDCLELAGSGLGVRNIYWLLDIVEETILNPAPDSERRQAFWNEVYARIEPLSVHLTPGQRISIAKLATTLGWHFNTETAAPTAEGISLAGGLSAGLEGKTVVIYSLTESASRQAAQVLTATVPTVRVSLTSDKCGTSALKSSAQNADVFVIATASAKHAATGFIQQHRSKQKPTLFASGRGFTSIIRAIEEHLMTSVS